MDLVDYLQYIYQGEGMTKDANGQWVSEDTLQPLPGVSQAEIEMGVHSVN